MKLSGKKLAFSLLMFIGIFIFNILILVVPAYFITKIPETSIPELFKNTYRFYAALLDLIVILTVNLLIYKKYYVTVEGNKSLYYTFSSIGFALYMLFCMLVCYNLNLKFDTLELHNFFGLSWYYIIFIYFIPLYSTIPSAHFLSEISQRRKKRTLYLFIKMFGYTTAVSALPAFFIMEIPEIITGKYLFSIALIDMAVMVVVNYKIHREYYVRLMRKKSQYYLFSFICFALYTSLCLLVCFNLDYRWGVYLYLPMGLFNFFELPWFVLVMIFFVPLLLTIPAGPHIRRIIGYFFSKGNRQHE